MSTGWVSTAAERAADAVQGVNEQIKDRLADAPVVFLDESATKVNGKQTWFHVAATGTLSAYHADEHSRGLKAMTAFEILPDRAGVVMHDAYSAYYSMVYPQQTITHQLCIAHIQRELAALAEHDPAAREDGWAQDADVLIEDLFRWRATHRATGSDQPAAVQAGQGEPTLGRPGRTGPDRPPPKRGGRWPAPRPAPGATHATPTR